MTTVAFPFGDIDIRTKLQDGGTLRGLPVVSPGVNADVADLGALRAEPLVFAIDGRRGGQEV